MDTWNGKPLIPLDENEPLRPGDVILIKFAWLIDGAWYRAYEWSVIEKKLEGRKDWRVISYRNEGEYLWAEIEVLPQPAPELQLASIGPLTILAIGGAVSTVVYALATVGKQYLIERRTIEGVEAGKLPVTVLGSKTATAQTAAALSKWSYVAGLAVVGWIILRLSRR